MGHTKSMGFFLVNIRHDSSPQLRRHWVLLANPSRLQCYHELARRVSSRTCFQQSGSGQCHIAERLWWQSFCSVTSWYVIAACEMSPSFRSHSRFRKRKIYLNHLDNQWLWVARHRFTLTFFCSSREHRFNCVSWLIFSNLLCMGKMLVLVVSVVSGNSPSGQSVMDEGKKYLEARAR